MITIKTCPVRFVVSARTALSMDPDVREMAKANGQENFIQATAMIVVQAILDVMDPNDPEHIAVFDELADQAVNQRWYNRPLSYDWAKVPLVRALCLEQWGHSETENHED